MSKATPLLLLLAVCVISLHCRQASAIVYKVTPAAQSSDGNDGVYSVLDALDRAVGGDTIELEDGTYTDQIHSTGPGQEGNPITIMGSRKAVVKATNPCVEITHSWITLEVRTKKVDNALFRACVNGCYEGFRNSILNCNKICSQAGQRPPVHVKNLKLLSSY